MPTRTRPTVPSLNRAIEEIESRLRAIVAEATERENLVHGLSFGLMARTADGLRAIRATSELGLPHELGAIGRIICEAGLQLAWILQTNGTDNTPEIVAARTQDLLDAANIDLEPTVREWARFGLTTQLAAAEIADRVARIRARRERDAQHAVPQNIPYNQAGAAGLAEAYALYYRTLCLSAHATVWASAAALQPVNEEVHSRNLFIVVSCSLLVIDCGLQLLGRGSEYAAIPPVVSDILGVDITAPPRAD